ncbi:MAG: YIP1 family protein [Gammaproteobacteria bacterium]|nr:YIP1 family protein [Gammaproteobacteria bacterium]
MPETEPTAASAKDNADSPTAPLSNSSNIPQPQNPITLAINVLTAPSEAFRTIRERPTSLFPLALILASTLGVMAWYFAILDYDWYIDDTLSQFPDFTEQQMADAREGMQSLSQNTMMGITMLSGGVTILVIYLIQSSYLSLVSALKGDEIRFRQWWSLVAWTNLPSLFVAISMAVTILLNPSGQLSALELNGLTLLSLGMETANPSLNRIFSTINLAMIWNLVLLVMAYRQWLQASAVRAMTVVVAPYLLIFGVWTYFAVG